MNTFQTLYPRCLWLFITGSLIGVVIENIWWKIKYGFWQTHVASLWFPLCSIYGFGAVGCYLGALLLAGQNTVSRFFIYALVGALVEFTGGFLLEHGLHMKAWDYSDTPLNIKGYVNLSMTILWGVLGLAFELLIPGLNRVFYGMKGVMWKIINICISVLLLADMAATVICLIRWSRRHMGAEAKTGLDRLIDRVYHDEKMKRRFNNWHFIDEPDLSRTRRYAADNSI